VEKEEGTNHKDADLRSYKYWGK